MTRWNWLFVVLWLIVSLRPSAGDDKGAKKDKDDSLIAAMKFVKLPKGTFWMGWTSSGKQSRKVEIKQDFELAAYLVSQEQWQTVMGNNPSRRVKDVPDEDLKRFPVENVSWNDIQGFLKKLNEREKGKGWRYRLPNEAEWEYACRGAATSKEECSFDFYLDKPTNDLTSKQANFDGRAPGGKGEKGPHVNRSTKVGSYPPNKLGLYDVHGNVWQQCDDVNHKEGEVYQPGGRTGVKLRGGSYVSTADNCRAGVRNGWGGPFGKANDVGFRLARVASP